MRQIKFFYKDDVKLFYGKKQPSKKNNKEIKSSSQKHRKKKENLFIRENEIIVESNKSFFKIQKNNF